MKSRVAWIGIFAVLMLVGVGVTSVRAEDYETIIKRAYEDILNRQPDPGGLRNYRSKMIDEDWSEKDVRNDLRNSEEYKNKSVDLTVTRAYEDILNRKPDPGGLANYRNKMLNEEWSEEDVRNSLRDSEEYRNKNR